MPAPPLAQQKAWENSTRWWFEFKRRPDVIHATSDLPWEQCLSHVPFSSAPTGPRRASHVLVVPAGPCAPCAAYVPSGSCKSSVHVFFGAMDNSTDCGCTTQKCKCERQRNSDPYIVP
jgi:hypothetical protein